MHEVYLASNVPDSSCNSEYQFYLFPCISEKSVIAHINSHKSHPTGNYHCTLLYPDANKYHPERIITKLWYNTLRYHELWGSKRSPNCFAYTG